MEVRRCLSLLIEEEESTRPDEFQLKKLFAVRCSCLKIIRPVFFICHNIQYLLLQFKILLYSYQVLVLALEASAVSNVECSADTTSTMKIY